MCAVLESCSKGMPMLFLHFFTKHTFKFLSVSSMAKVEFLLLSVLLLRVCALVRNNTLSLTLLSHGLDEVQLYMKPIYFTKV